MSRAEALVALTAKPGGTALQLCSPTVGILRGVPEPGRILGPGHAFASLTILGRTHPLLVPEGIAGVVESLAVEGWGADTLPVEHGQPILTLAPIGVARAEGHGEEGGPSEAGAGSGAGRGIQPGTGTAARGGARAAAGIGPGAAQPIPEGCHAVVCPADGIFYRRPRPGDPPYVEVGADVRNGQTLGLIEAMKTFSPIPYGGPGLPSPARVVEVRADDSAEVRHGQVIFVVR
jgi:acetyl-CoA carboxylase biotin carboxyl carrier protein